MKKIAIAFFICVLIHLSEISFAEETIRLTNGEWPPYLGVKLKNYPEKVAKYL
jgi:hypothetical protein